MAVISPIAGIVQVVAPLLAMIVAGPVASAQPPSGIAAPNSASRTAAIRAIRYIAGSTAKINQLIGDVDKQRDKPTLSRTVSRYQLLGTDLGYSFEHKKQVYFLFGDTVGKLRMTLDTMATSDTRNPDQGVRLDFLTAPGRPYLTIEPPGISMGAFETPAGGVSVKNQMYVVVRTGHAENWSTDRTVLTRFAAPATFEVLRTMSGPPTARFLTMSLHVQPGSIKGLPSGGPFVLIWGTGKYRESDAYLSIVPVAHFETGKGTRYYAGLNGAGAPAWSDKESKAAPIVTNGGLGDLSVTWCKDLGVWLMTYDHRSPFGVMFSYSHTPWGPWSAPQHIFSLRDGEGFIHNPLRTPDDGLSDPLRTNVHGGAYAPYVVERWTKLQGNELSLYYVISTWNPYVVVLMKSRFQINR
jgi:hypothetical protein